MTALLIKDESRLHALRQALQGLPAGEARVLHLHRLLSQDPDWVHVGDGLGNRPVHGWLDGSSEDGVALAAVWRQHGGDVEVQDARGETLLFRAARSHALPALEWLTAQGADWTVQNRAGLTPLQVVLEVEVRANTLGLAPDARADAPVLRWALQQAAQHGWASGKAIQEWAMRSTYWGFPFQNKNRDHLHSGQALIRLVWDAFPQLSATERQTALMRPLQQLDAPVVAALLTEGLDPNGPLEDGRPPLAQVLGGWSVDRRPNDYQWRTTVEALLDAGARWPAHSPDEDAVETDPLQAMGLSAATLAWAQASRASQQLEAIAASALQAQPRRLRL